ncbi:MAG: WYL domain-containing protein [Odoribacter sp.]|nr:WYL domain-containing protein [Odoribacter sp.]
MPKNKNAEYRFLVLDRCFSDFRHKYTIEDLLEKVNDKLYDANGSKSMIMKRQLRGDLNAIRKMLPDDIYLEAIPYDGKKCYYRYSKPDFSIYQNELSVAEVQNLRSTIEMLGKYRGLPSNGWLEEVISNLEIRFGVKSNAENLVSFGQNEQLKGLEYLSDIIDATINHQPLGIEYISANGKHHLHTLHPYFVKQYNERWYLLGLDEKEERIKNLAFDRIQCIAHSNHTFRKNEFIDFNSYFDNVVGVTVPNEAKLEEFVLRFTPQRFKYVTSKPIHKSQKTINEEDCIISLTLYHTLELEQQIFSFGPDVEVLSPTWFREEFAKKISDCMKKYFPRQNLCIGKDELCSRHQTMEVKL